MPFTDYITTNYDYAFETAIGEYPEKLSTEKIYSLRRERRYRFGGYSEKSLWNIHGEIDYAKSIMLGLDHYCGSISKVSDYIKGNYSYEPNGETRNIKKMEEKLKSRNFCHTSWVDLFFSGDVHIIGFSLDYSEIDIWWLLNKWARFKNDGLIGNKILFYTSYANDDVPDPKNDLLKSFGVEVVKFKVKNGDYKGMYNEILDTIDP